MKFSKACIKKIKRNGEIPSFFLANKYNEAHNRPEIKAPKVSYKHNELNVCDKPKIEPEIIIEIKGFLNNASDISININ